MKSDVRHGTEPQVWGQEIQTYELRLDRHPDAPLAVRQWVAKLPGELPRDVELLTHELVVNVLTHTDSPEIFITLLVLPDCVHVQVANDGAEGRPHISPPEAFSESGRGMRWVDALSEEWGVGCTDATHVWFQVPRDS